MVYGRTQIERETRRSAPSPDRPSRRVSVPDVLPVPLAARQGKPLLLIVDDDEEIRTQLRWSLADDYSLLQAGDREEAMQCIRERKPSVVLLDLGLPPRQGDPEEGLAALRDILQADRSTKVIIASGQNERAHALRAIGSGAYDFLSKPVALEELKAVLRRCFHVASLERDHRLLQRRAAVPGFGGMLGACPAMQTAFNAIRKVGASDAPVLILGESGTGKELAARAIHDQSSRRGGPFVALNCSAIPETLLESTLFGHEKGAFTGAHAQQKGRVEQAEGGTLFLDEIGDVPLPVQVKLLRFLQEKTLERVGGRGELTVNARVVAATNVDLEAAMRQGRFREDFFYRLAVVRIALPPLRQRGSDLQLLAEAFLENSARDYGREPLSFGQDALEALGAHPWPGNVRELQNRIRRAAIMAESARLTAADLELAPPAGDAALTLDEARADLERRLAAAALRRHNGKIAPAAAELGISRPTLYELIARHGLGRPVEDS
jgi:two-component system, NtrC family, response regulator